jgi:hypothetical protein
VERAIHEALTEFCERHLPVLSDTANALLPVWNEGNTVWTECVATVGDPELPTHHEGWALTARYSQHVSFLFQEVIATGAHLRLRLEECAGQVKAKNHAVKDIQKGNRELLQKNATQGHVTHPPRGPPKVVVAKTGQVNYTAMEDIPEGEQVLMDMFSLNGYPAVVLFDSGATHDFISKSCTQRCQLSIHHIDTPYLISTPGGRVVTK